MNKIPLNYIETQEQKNKMQISFKQKMVVWILLVVARYLCDDEETRKEISTIKTHIYIHKA